MLFIFSSGVVSVVSKRALGVMDTLNKKRSLHVGLGGEGGVWNVLSCLSQ